MALEKGVFPLYPRWKVSHILGPMEEEIICLIA